MALKIEGGQARTETELGERFGLTKEDMKDLSSEERRILLDMLTNADPKDLEELSGPTYDREMVDMETFLFDEYFLGNIGKTLYPCWVDDLIELFSGDYHEAIISGAIGIGKNCCISGSLITTNQGMMPVERVVARGNLGEDLKIRTHEGQYQRAYAFHDVGMQPTIKVTSSFGYEFEGRPNHRVIVVDGTELAWKRLDEIKEGDTVVLDAGEDQEFGETDLSEAEAELIGAWTGDGWFSSVGRSIHISTGNDEHAYREHVHSLCESAGLKHSEHKASTAQEVTIHSVKTVDRWKRMGLVTGSREKHVPDVIFASSKRVAGAFIRGLFDTDGTVYGSVVEFTTTSDKLASQIQLLLLQFGIVSSRTSKTNDYGPVWTVRLIGNRSKEIFAEYIGFNHQDKAAKLKAIMESEPTTWRHNDADVLHGMHALVAQVWKDLPLPRKPHRNLFAARYGKQNVTRDTAMRIAALVAAREAVLPSALRLILARRLAPLKVEKIEHGEGHCYDLSIERDESYVAHGFLSHNTMSSVAVCRMVYEMSCLRDPQAMFGLEKGSEIAFCCISVNEKLAKHAVFGGIKTKIMSSRYFMEQFPYKPTLTELRFPNNIWIAASSSSMSSALSLNTFGGILDEVNFMPMTPPRVQKIRHGAKRRERASHAETLYNMILRRMKSRYNRAGKVPGILLLISSKSHTDSFTENRIRAAQDNPNVFVREYCLTGDTKIPLLDGSTKTIRELAETRHEDEFWVYSCDPHTKQIVPGRAHHPRLTLRDAEIYEVGLDNGEVVRCTGNHPFMLRDGEYKRAEDLEAGDSLMPLYRQTDDKGYEEVAHPGWDGRWQKTHHMSALSRHGRWPKTGPDGLPTVIHHEDFDKTNNEPGNLSVKEWTEHQQIHAEQMDCLASWVGSDEHRAFSSQNMTRLHQDPEFARRRNERGAEHFRKLWQDPDFRASASIAAGERLSDFHRTKKGRKRQQERSLKYWDGKRKFSLEEVREAAENGETITAFAERMGCNPASVSSRLKRNGWPLFSEMKRAAGHFSPGAGGGRYSNRAPNNHKVVSVRKVGREDVYDLSVEKWENFCLDAGVVVHNSLWDAKPRKLFAMDTFDVFVGNERIQSRLVESEQQRNELEDYINNDADYADCQITAVPVDFKSDFMGDLDSALQDLAGIATVSISPFIQRREDVYEAIDATREHPMETEAWNPRVPPKINWNMLTRKYRVRDSNGFTSDFEGPIVNPAKLRHVHIDTSLNHDCTGVCISHIDGYTKVQRRDNDGSIYLEDAPIIYVDFMLRIVPPPGEDIIMADIRTLLYSFIDHGYQFALVTTDGYQSVEMRQYIEAQRGIETALQSVDKKEDPYLALRSAIYERRISYYHYEPFLHEVQRLIHDKVKGKIDHPEAGSKDVSDALAGCAFTLVDRGSNQPIPMRLGLSEYDSQESPDAWIKQDLGIGEDKRDHEIDSAGDLLFPVVG